MSEVHDLVADLEREIEVDRRALAAKEAALELLKGRLRGSPSKAPAIQTAERAAPAEGELFDLDSLDVLDASRRRTFVDELRDAVARFGPQEFSIGHVEAALKRLGIEVAGKTPRSRISASLSKLHEEGYLWKTSEGGGNVPHRYRIRSQMTDEQAKVYAKLNERRGLADVNASGGKDEDL